MELLVIVAVVAVVGWVVSAPLRRGNVVQRDLREASLRADLEARKEAKYREIREAEMDWRTGKLSEPDYRALDRRLRREAIDLLSEIDRLPDPGELKAKNAAKPKPKPNKGGGGES